jgi:phenylpyruvate tautomerase PptA (4-oxalocrotonate tautomerase family)
MGLKINVISLFPPRALDLEKYPTEGPMPFVTISMLEGRTAEARAKISEAVHQAMVDTINIPADDKFQLINEKKPGTLVYDVSYGGVSRTDGLIVVQITLNAGRPIEKKRALYARIAELLKEWAGVRPEDVVVSLVEVTKENWSFGNGLATYALS